MGIFDMFFGKSLDEQELQRQKQIEEECLSILIKCKTREQIIEGFERVERLLKQANNRRIARLSKQKNNMLADATKEASLSCMTLSDENVLRLRDRHIKIYEDFLSEYNVLIDIFRR